MPLAPWVDELVGAMRVTLRVGGERACYLRRDDRIDVPPPSAFPEPVNWYRTVLHELAHATGHEDLLARDLSGWFGTTAYAREELVAELAAAFQRANLGTVLSVRHADYIGSWLQVLRVDERAIRRPRNTNRWSQDGSRSSTSCTSSDRPPILLGMSV